ncbi:MAG TPA: alpha/beta fold hydrolase [Planctomycetota bacterium]|nr:alpha/beta fold hydrolase [Planctomycetota bacterium]
MSGKDEGKIRTLAMRDGAELHCRHWSAGSTTPRGAVVAVHGIRSHSGWYVDSCAHVARAGYDVTFVDRRGSGLNRFARGDVERFEVLVDDLCEHVDDVRRRLGDVPVHLHAVSWGAKLACATLIRRPDLARSLTLVAPGLVSLVDVSPGVKLRTALALLANPKKLFDVPLNDPQLFTDNSERIAWIEDDPLSLRRCTARFLYQTRRLDRFVRRHARKLRIPVLVTLAGLDRIVDNTGVRRLVERFASRPKEIVEYPDAAHTLEFEPDPSGIFDDMVKWLDARG